MEFRRVLFRSGGNFLYRSSSSVCRLLSGISLPRISTCSTPVVNSNGSPDQTTGVEHRSEEHTSELQSHSDLVCRLLLEKKKKKNKRKRQNKKNRRTTNDN